MTSNIRASKKKVSKAVISTLSLLAQLNHHQEQGIHSPYEMAHWLRQGLERVAKRLEYRTTP